MSIAQYYFIGCAIAFVAGLYCGWLIGGICARNGIDANEAAELELDQLVRDRIKRERALAKEADEKFGMAVCRNLEGQR